MYAWFLPILALAASAPVLAEQEAQRELMVASSKATPVVMEAMEDEPAIAPIADLPRIAIIIDDLGLNRTASQSAIDLPVPLTLSFISYAPGLPNWAKAAEEAGHELMLHVPMEPMDHSHDAGEMSLSVHHSREEIVERLHWALERFEGFNGINNHMGSRFTADDEAMATVMEVLQERGLFFVDSRTTADSVAKSQARHHGVPFLSRDVFIDHGQPDLESLEVILSDLEERARKQGRVIAIAHPYSETLIALERWLPTVKERGLRVVSVAELLKGRELQSSVITAEE